MLQIEQDLLEKLLRDVLRLGDFGDEGRLARRLLGERHQRPQSILGLL